MERAGDYLVGPRLATGGANAIHLAVRDAPGFLRVAVVKRVRDDVAQDPVAVELLEHEARLMAHVQHAKVVPVLDVVQHGAELLLVSEYVHGLTLAELHRRGVGPVPIGIAVAIGRDLLEGLAAAHGACREGKPLGIVHRDVSPDNVIVGDDGTARVLDFGIAHAIGRRRLTHTGEVRGKIAYAAPEHVAGEPLDARADVYSAAVVIWELLAGRRLFEGSGSALVEQVGIGLVDPVRVHRPEVPKALSDLVSRALATDPAARPTSAAEFARDLDQTFSPDSPASVASWLGDVAGPILEERATLVRELEAAAAHTTTTATASTPDARVASPQVHARSRAASARVWVAGSLIAAFLAIGPLAYLWSRASREPTHVAPSNRVVTGSTSARGPAEERGIAIQPLPPVDVTADEIPPSTSSTSVRSTKADAQARARVHAKKPDPSGQSHAAASCERPYTTDAFGRRTYKLECVDR